MARKIALAAQPQRERRQALLSRRRGFASLLRPARGASGRRGLAQRVAPCEAMRVESQRSRRRDVGGEIVDEQAVLCAAAVAAAARRKISAFGSSQPTWWERTAAAAGRSNP